MSTPAPESAVPPDDVSAAPAVEETPGLMLKAAREGIGLSLADVAMRLRMGVRQVDALERGEYAALPTGTFLRGFVRNYAKVVNVDGDQAIRLLEKCNAEAARLKAATIVVPSQDIHIHNGGSVLALPKARIAIYALVFAMLAAAVWYWWQFIRPNLASGGRPAVAAQPRPAAPAPTAVSLDASNVQASPSQIEMAVAPTPSQTPPIASSAATPAATTPAVVKPAAPVGAETVKPAEPAKPAAPRTGSAARGAHLLGFTFSGDCWVEVTDADGRILLSRQYHEGESGEVGSSAVPISVVFGNAQNARMAHNGKELDLAPFTRISVARVTIK